MVKSENSKENKKYKIAVEELSRIKKIVKGHEKLLKAIGRL